MNSSQPSQRHNAASPEPGELLRLEGISKVYAPTGAPGSGASGASNEPGDQAGVIVRALDNIDLAVSEGEFLALQGTSGSGKSTLLHLLGLLDSPSSGRYLFRGQDVAHWSDEQKSALRNERVGFVFQSFYLIPYITALDNALLPGLYSRKPQKILRQRAEHLLERMGMADRRHFRPSQLSGGQQQRVALARALVNDPDLLLADEPTGQLDSNTGAEIMQLMAAINDQGKTVILVTHDPRTASFARRVVRVEDGRLV